MKNKFNLLTSKEWLPFQKSWFIYQSKEKLYKENLRFFTLPETNKTVRIFFYGSKSNKEILKKVVTNDFQIVDDFKDSFQFAIIDLLDFKYKIEDIANISKKIYPKIENRKFITIFVQNELKSNYYNLNVWNLAINLSKIFSLKDEKISCLKENISNSKQQYFRTTNNCFYCLYFRKDESSSGLRLDNVDFNNYYSLSNQIKKNKHQLETFKSWYIIKPKPRTKNEILHPAKFPEEVIDIFIKNITLENQNILDPMLGTASTIVSCIRNNRNGYGTELSKYFFDIAKERCENIINPIEMNFDSLWGNKIKFGKYKILLKDARKINKLDFPVIDYIITSPPYWDMLNMKGAEHQAQRKEKGLKLNYSASDKDMGNIDDYNLFLDELINLYKKLFKIIKTGSYLTVIVKNIKKKGKNYPLAWDLALGLQKQAYILPEIFWLQDDISIAPYGYGNTWVSNTFHHYCLNFQKK